jgi:hypothetical protein
MSLVIDTSIAVKWVSESPDRQAARLMLPDHAVMPGRDPGIHVAAIHPIASIRLPVDTRGWPGQARP